MSTAFRIPLMIFLYVYVAYIYSYCYVAYKNKYISTVCWVPLVLHTYMCVFSIDALILDKQLERSSLEKTNLASLSSHCL